MKIKIRVLFIGLVLATMFWPKMQSYAQDRETLIHDGLTREFFVYTPQSYDTNKPLPLLLNFHGFGGSAYLFMFNTQFNRIAEKEQFIVVYPQGTLINGKSHWNVGGWTRKSTADDVGFVKALIDYLQKNYAIDHQRIYAAGMSNGGYMSVQLACQMGDIFTAVASVTGSMTPEMHQQCSSDEPVPVLQLHGTNDRVVPYAGGQGWTLPIDDVIKFWVEKNKANSKPKIKKLPDLDPTDNSTVIRYAYRNDSKKVMVMHYKVVNGGHDWFGIRGNMDIHASELIWDFFSSVQH